MTQMTVTTDFISYRKQVEQYAKLTGLSLKEAMEESVAILSGQLARRFPPKSKSEGQRAIDNDLSRIINTTMSKRELTDGLAKTGHNLFDPSGSQIEAWHEKHRADNRKWRYRPDSIRGTQRLKNGWLVSYKLYAPKSEVKAYAQKRKEHVGTLKANWTAGTALGGAAKVAAWVTRHGLRGRIVNEMKPNGNGYIEFANPLKHASNWGDINAFVVRSQGKMFAHRIRAVLKKQTDAANARGAA